MIFSILFANIVSKNKTFSNTGNMRKNVIKGNKK